MKPSNTTNTFPCNELIYKRYLLYTIPRHPYLSLTHIHKQIQYWTDQSMRLMGSQSLPPQPDISVTWEFNSLLLVTTSQTPSLFAQGGMRFSWRKQLACPIEKQLRIRKKGADEERERSRQKKRRLRWVSRLGSTVADHPLGFFIIFISKTHQGRGSSEGRTRAFWYL